MKNNLFKRGTLMILLCLFLMLFQTACSGNQPVASGDKKAQDSKTVTVNPNDIKIQRGPLPLKYTNGFSVDIMDGGYKMVTDAAGRKVLLVPKDNVDMKIVKEYKNKVQAIVKVPVERVVITSEQDGGFIRACNALDKVIACQQNREPWVIPELKSGMESKKIANLGVSYNYDKFLDNILNLVKPKKMSEDSFNGAGDLVVFDYAIYQVLESKTVTSTKDGKKVTVAAALDILGLPYIVEKSTWEKSHLGRLEWLKLYTPFFNREKEAVIRLTEAEKRMDNLKGKIKDGSSRPNVAWGYMYDKDKRFKTPGANNTSILAGAAIPFGDSYVSTMIQNAGGKFVFDPASYHGLSGSLTIEDFISNSNKGDIYIASGNPEQHPSKDAVIKRVGNEAKNLKPLAEGRTWCYQTGFNQNIDRIDEIVEELQSIIYEKKTSGLKYFHKVP